MTKQNDVRKLAEQMAASMSSFDDIKAAHAILYRYRS